MDSQQTTNKSKVFFDSSAIFSAALSSAGGARQLIRLAFRGDIALVVSAFVLAEAKKNISQKAPEALQVFEILTDLLAESVVEPDVALVAQVATRIEPKDAPI